MRSMANIGSIDLGEDPIGWASGQANNFSYAEGNPSGFADPERGKPKSILKGGAPRRRFLHEVFAVADVVCALPIDGFGVSAALGVVPTIDTGSQRASSSALSCWAAIQVVLQTLRYRSFSCSRRLYFLIRPSWGFDVA